MEDHIRMYCYCANQRDTFESENAEEQTATRMMFNILARAYEREILREGFDEVNRRKAKGVM